MRDEAYVPGTCPGEETLFAFLDGELDAESLVAILRHLSTCESCRQAVGGAAALLKEVSVSLLAAGPVEPAAASRLDSMEEDIVQELKAAGIVSRRRLDVKALARKIGQGTARGVAVAASSLVSGARLAYSGASYLAKKKSDATATATAVAKVAGGAGKAVSWLTARSQWRLAW